MVQRSRLGQTAVYLAAVIVLVACAGQGSDLDGESETATHPAAATSTTMDGVVGGSVERAEGDCTGAELALDGPPGRVVFLARCSTATRGRAVITIRPALERNQGSGAIVKYGRMLAVSRSGARDAAGTCMLRGGRLTCSAHLDGGYRVVGVFWMRPSASCSVPLEIVEIHVPGCRAANCEGDPFHYPLLRGEPKGCAR